MIFFSRNIARKETREIASLSVEECEDASFIGCRFEIPMEEYPALAMREAEFNFTAVVTRDVETNEVVAIKKVLQDKRFKNRELQIMRQLVKDPHTNIVALKHCFYSQVR